MTGGKLANAHGECGHHACRERDPGHAITWKCLQGHREDLWYCRTHAEHMMATIRGFCRCDVCGGLMDVVREGGVTRLAGNLSFKCRMYGAREHAPCSGTTDDGRGAQCECWCHDASSSRGATRVSFTDVPPLTGATAPARA